MTPSGLRANAQMMDTSETHPAAERRWPPTIVIGRRASGRVLRIELLQVLSIFSLLLVATGSVRFNSSVGRLTSNSIDGLQALVSELQRMQEFLNSEVDKVQRQIDSALAGINIIVETIGPWKSIAGSQTLPSDTRNLRAGGPAANIEQRFRVG